MRPKETFMAQAGTEVDVLAGMPTIGVWALKGKKIACNWDF